MRPRPSPRIVLAISSLGAAIAFIDATIVNIALPNIAQSFHGTPISTLSWVLTAYNIVFAAFLMAAAQIADVLGRRRVFIFGLELFTIGSLLCAIAPSADALIAFRIVQALGAAFLVPSSLALVLNAFPTEHRSHGVALWSAAAAAAAGVGPALGGLLVAAANWRLVFLINLPLGIAGVLLARRRLVESRAPGRRRIPDFPGSLLLAIAIGLLVLGIVKGQDWGWGSARIIGCFAVALAVGAVVVWRCTWHRSPIIDLPLLKVRTFSVANAATVIGAAGFYGYTLSNVLFLTGIWGYSELQAGLALTIGPIVAVAVAGPTSRLVQHVGPRPVLVAGGLFWGGAVMWFVARVGTTPDFVGEWLPGMVLLGIGGGTLFPNLSGTAVASVPGRSFAMGTGMNSVARQIGAALGVAIVVAVIGTPTPATAYVAFQHAWIFGAVCLFVAGLACLLVGPINVDKAPALGDAARAVLTETVPREVVHPPRRRPHMIAPGNGDPSVARAESAADFLARTPLFSDIDPAHHDQLAARSRTRHLEAGQWLIHEQEPADAMYVVRAGRLEVVDETAGTVIRELGRGDALGELALLTDSPRSASVRAARPTDVLVVDRADFDKLLESSPALSLALSRSLGRQLRDTHAPAPTVRPRPTTVALIALDAGIPLPRIAIRLGDALSAHVSIAVLGGAEGAARAGRSGPATTYGPLLDRAEAGHDLVLLIGGFALQPEPWTTFCIQQADRILALTGGGPVPPALTRLPELQGCDLVAYDTAPGELDGWASALNPVESHVIREPEFDADIARTARRLTGTSIGIVLSGGGARAFSHIGVLEELTAAGVTIDRVAGVSMGAVIGALFAMGHDADEMDAICFEEWVQRRPLNDYTFPRYSLIRGERFLSMLHRTYGTRLIEELPRGLICCSAELRSGRLEIARQGPLWEAVAFSMCLPIIAPPRIRGREMFIDGSLVDNLPIRPMADMGEGPIIAVDVKAAFDRSKHGSRVAPPEGERAHRPPSLTETLTRVLLLGSANTTEAARRYADLLIKPHAEGVGLLEFHQLDAARAAGRVAAREALERAPTSLLV